MFGVAGELFHVGIRVTDLQSAMDEIGRTHGVTWATLQDRMMEIWLPDRGSVTVRLAVTYSREGPVHLELMESDEAPWHAGDTPGPHHLGYWVDDVRAETERLVAAGWTVEMAAAPPDAGYGRYTYVRSPQGVLFEPVSSAARPRLEAWWAGGALAPSPTR
jgi:hypothetical protein